MTKILVVEDDQGIAMSLVVRLRAAGYEVVVAYDGVFAMATAVKERPDLILIDICLPGGGGWAVAERVANLAQTAGTPVIFMTASKRPGLREHAHALGAAGFLEKPYEASELLELIRTALAGRAVPLEGPKTTSLV